MHSHIALGLLLTSMLSALLDKMTSAFLLARILSLEITENNQKSYQNCLSKACYYILH